MKSHSPSNGFRLVRTGVALIVSAMTLWSCSRSPAKQSAAAPAEKTIAVSLLTMQHQFYQELRAGLESAADELHYRLIVSSAEFDPARQANQIDEFIVQHVDAIVLCPSDSRSVGATVLAANDASIPVVTADIASQSTLGQVQCHIASDNFAGGRKAATLLARAMNDEGQVVILSQPEVSSVSDRVRGFREEMKSHPKIEIVAELSAEGRRDRAVTVMEDLLQSQPDLTGVFGINDDSALGALAAVESAGKLDTVHIVGYDATPEARKRIDAGDMYGDVIQYPRRIGELTIHAIDDLLNGRPVPKIIPVQVGSYTGGA